ncbi:MAG: sensor histidine kinase [Betaproteobacteria bacterium]
MRGYAWAAASAAASTLVGLAAGTRLQLVNIAMIYMLAVVVVALRFERGPVIAAAVLGVAAFNFFFVPPVHTFTVDDPQHLLAFGMMLAVGLVISGLTASVRRQAEARARSALEAETERIRSTLLASISHDLRTPLAVIAGAASGLAERGEQMPAAERVALAQSIFRQSREMSELVAKVLDMTRLDSGAVAPRLDWGSMGEIASAVLDRLKDPLSAHMVMVDLPADLPLVRMDAVLVEQVLANLLENAARHTPPRTLVRLRAWVKSGEMVASVEDYGPGLPEGEAGKMFAKFQRAAGTRQGGVGLGLAICRAIVELHGGRIWAEAIPGGGTAFRFSLPLEPSPNVPAEQG